MPWTPRYLYIPSAPSQFGQILASLERTLLNLSTLDLAKIGASADRALNSADATFRKFGELDTPGISRNVNKAATDASAAVREYQGRHGCAAHAAGDKLENIGTTPTGS